LRLLTVVGLGRSSSRRRWPRVFCRRTLGSARRSQRSHKSLFAWSSRSSSSIMVLAAKYIVVITDSGGGLQNEAYLYSKPSGVVHVEAEWIERSLEGERQVRRGDVGVTVADLYGDGDASRRIVAAVGAAV
jgi:hypothetical protein